MFKDHKHLKLLLVLVILLSLLGTRYTYAEQNDGGSNVSAGRSLKTEKAYIGDYTERTSLKNMELRPLKEQNVTIEDAKGNLVEFMVGWGQVVKKDQPLLSYTVPVDELLLEEKEINLKKSEESFKRTVEEKELDIAESMNQLMTMNASSIEAQIYMLNIEKMKISLEQYIYQTERSLEKQRKELEDLKANKELKYVKAPFDGIVYWFDGNLKRGAILERGQGLVYMADINSAVLQAESAGASKLWYNLDVTINPINNKQENTAKSFKGKVVAIDSLLNGEAKTGMVYIKPESISEEMANPGQRANINAIAIEVKNVLLIPSRAVKADKGLKYVNIVDSNGEVRKQYISGRDNGNETWVYNGLSEGQEIVIE